MARAESARMKRIWEIRGLRLLHVPSVTVPWARSMQAGSSLCTLCSASSTGSRQQAAQAAGAGQPRRRTWSHHVGQGHHVLHRHAICAQLRLAAGAGARGPAAWLVTSIVLVPMDLLPRGKAEDWEACREWPAEQPLCSRSFQHAASNRQAAARAVRQHSMPEHQQAGIAQHAAQGCPLC
jgi:hypothetical protein